MLMPWGKSKIQGSVFNARMRLRDQYEALIVQPCKNRRITHRANPYLHSKLLPPTVQ